MLRIQRPVQSSAAYVGVLKFDPNQPRTPSGTSHGGEFASTHAQQADIAPVQTAFTAEASRMAPGLTPRSMGQRDAVKKQIQQNITARLKNNPAFADMEPRPPMNLEPVAEWVKSKIDLWANTSGDSDVDAGTMQLAVQEEFGLADAAMDHIQTAIKQMHGGLIRRLPEKEGPRLRAFVRAEYEATQEWFKKQGITHVSVFRGMDDEHDQLGYGHEDVTMQPASSWSTNLETAITFTEDKANPKVLTTRVPVSQVLSTCVTGRGCLKEQEVILLGKPQRARVFGIRLESETSAYWQKKISDTLE